MPQVTLVQETRSHGDPKGSCFSHLEVGTTPEFPFKDTQTNVMEILELSMHNSEAKEEPLASGTASQGLTPPCPGKRDLQLPLTSPIWVWQLINSRSKVKEGVNQGSH